MNTRLNLFLILILIFHNASAKTLNFSNLEWNIQDGYGSPGPNYWSGNNAWVDKQGWLHLKITQQQGKWYSAGISTIERLGFGKYWFYVANHAERFDPNVTLALFNYPTHDIGPDETNEIDIELFKSSHKKTNSLETNYIVWPTSVKIGRTSMTFQQNYQGAEFTHGFIWNQKHIDFFSSNGHSIDYKNLISSWSFSPPDYEARIPQNPLPVYIDFYFFQGKPLDSSKKEFEIIIKNFCFEAEKNKKSNCALHLSS